VLKGKGSLLAMLAGTLLIGLSGYLFLALIGRGRFDPTTTAALSATYLLAVILGPGVFVAVEQETSRVVSYGLARGTALRAAVRRLVVICLALAALTLLVLLAVAPVLLGRILDGDVGLVLALVVSVIGSAAVYYVRGISGGQRRFGRYAVTVFVDGAARIVGVVGLVLAGNTNPTLYALALCAGPAIAWACTAIGSAVPAGGRSAEPPAWGVLGRDVSWLLVASVLSLALANLAPVVVTGMLTDGPAIAAGFATAVVLTRVPLLLMGPIQAILLPRMTAAAAADNRPQLRRDIATGLSIIGVIGGLAVVSMALLGRPVLSLLFGADRDSTSSPALVLLTVSATLFMAVLLLQPALVSLRRHTELMLSWLAGALVFAACFLLPLDAVDRGVLAQLAGPVVTLLGQLITLRLVLRPRAATLSPAVTGRSPDPTTQ